MLLNKNTRRTYDNIIYQTRPNMILGCRKAIFGIVLLVIILMLSPVVIKFIGEMQVYLISSIKLPLTRYVSIAFFVIILITVIYIIWQLIGWYSTEYTLTDSKIIIKSGVLSNKKNYMPYANIQDINTSQSIIARLVNVGSVYVFSAYDKNQMELKNIFNPSEVEEIIFSKMMELRGFQTQPQRFPNAPEDNYYPSQEYYDDFEPITPLHHERSYQKRNYEYYPEEIQVDKNHHRYEYEPYGNEYINSQNNNSQNDYYNQLRDEYSYVEDDYYHEDDSEIYYNDGVDDFTQDNQDDLNSSDDVIKRHFDKFKR